MDDVIRPAEVGDALKVAELNEVVQALHYQERPDWFKEPDAASLLPSVYEWLQSPSGHVLVAESDAKLLGYVLGTSDERPDTALKYGLITVELDQIAVEPQARRRGIGTALCQGVIEWATGIGAAQVELGTWAFNKPAHRVFQSAGFTPTIQRMSLTLPQSDAS